MKLNLQDGVTCLHLSAYCDHRIDCPDNSDEGHQCKQAPSCHKMSCSHKCAITWKGPKCYCPEGLVPDSEAGDGTTCIDYDECSEASEVKFIHSFSPLTYKVKALISHSTGWLLRSSVREFEWIILVQLPRRLQSEGSTHLPSFQCSYKRACIPTIRQFHWYPTYPNRWKSQSKSQNERSFSSGFPTQKSFSLLDFTRFEGIFQWVKMCWYLQFELILEHAQAGHVLIANGQPNCRGLGLQ